ncbi:MAG: DUF2326 domain-containing protein [Arcicella sp.]|jgi:uncharacterized protein YydD (DUF2326 family)|nr:DUF2326 domain-containing protein [Arcicella sp.]
MKLSKIYSNKPFQNTIFILEKGGLNAIIGDAKDKQSKQHNLGKSKLGELIDFLLLKGIDSKFFFYKDSAKEKFKGYEFYLEILLNNGKYLTIKRIVDSNTKISFKLNDARSTDFIYYENFDTTLAFDKAKEYLNDRLDFDFCKSNDESYRRLVNYSLRSQGDYEPKMKTIFQLRKFAKNKDKDWKPLLFSLLGFDGKVLKEKYELEENIKEDTKTIKSQEKDFGIKSEDKDAIVGKIQNVEIDRETLRGELESLNFYNQDKATIQNLVGSIEEEIAELNTKLYNTEYDIKKLNDSIRNEFSFDIKKIKNIFDEVDLYFPDKLTKSYEQLIDFNHQITQERNSQIRQTLSEKLQEEKEISGKLIVLNKKREQFRELIQDTSLFKKYAIYQKKMIEIERELYKYQTQLDAIKEMEEKKEKIEEKQKHELQEVKDQLKEIVDNTANCTLYMSIRKTFSEIVKRVLNENALIKISPNSNYNIEFDPDFPNSAKDEGATYYKILCVAFDLAILINYREQSHFRFVYHDDVISGDDNGVKSRLIEVVREICEKYNIQYIFSAIKDNIPQSQDISQNIILELNDKDDNGKLFKMSF